jgi:hypothetical protein
MKTKIIIIAICFVSIFFGSSKAQISDTVSILPNPFQNQTSIRFTLIESDTVSITFYNRWGGVVLRPMVNQILSAGFQNIEILTDSLSFGVYFYSVDFGSGLRKAGWAIKGSITSIETKNFVAEKSTLIFPNPSSDMVFVPGEGLKEIRIQDLSGKEVSSFTSFQNEISIRELSTGTYILQVFDKARNMTFTGKVFKVD